MNAYRYALIMEDSIRQEVMLRRHTGPRELEPLLDVVIACQAVFINRLQKVLDTADLNDYLDLEFVQMPLETNLKFEVKEDLAPNQLMSLYMTISAISAINERSSQFYRQAAANSAYEYEKNFFISLAEHKKVVKRRIDSTMRIIYNSLWSQVGFAPFIFGRE